VLDLTCAPIMDSAGLGELVRDLRFRAAPRNSYRTRWGESRRSRTAPSHPLDSFFAMHPDEASAIAALR
jgi:hypothetical protein